MQEQAHKHILPVQASKPARSLVRLLFIQLHSADYQLHCILRQQVTPTSKVPTASTQTEVQTEVAQNCSATTVCYACYE